ncbi:MAG: hypothetical protein O6947_02580 [Acidobacteria bacterium]|nr:hypothetical protein [Acidobacteriota bacterium]
MPGTPGPKNRSVWEILEDRKSASKRMEAIRTCRSLKSDLVDFLWERLAEVPDPDQALRNLEKLAASPRFPAARELLNRILLLFGTSQYLSDILLHNPEWIAWLGRRDCLEGRKTREDLEQELAQFHFRASTRQDRTLLRQFKNREYLRIGLRDFLGTADLSETTQELSDLADILLEKALLLTYQALQQRYGRPQFIDPQGRLVDSTFAVISLGKLGGRELNYSSDIDLLFLFSEEGETSGQRDTPGSLLSNRQWFTRLAEGIIERISSVGPTGHVFRIDMELRPGGRDGELIHSLRSALTYYQVWGKGWERQALLKGRFSAGDEILGRKFLEGVSAIIHGDIQQTAFAQEVARIQQRQQERLSEEEKSQELKHGPGGMRQLELSVQALQLIHSFQDPWLREGNTLRALHRLSDKGLISIEQHETLARAYVFLRTVEHRLQLHANLQTFRLPGDSGRLRILARSLGYRDGPLRGEKKPFLDDLGDHRRFITTFFRSVLGSRAQVAGNNLLLDEMTSESLRNELAQYGFPDPEVVLRPLNSIRRSLLKFRNWDEGGGMIRRSTPGLLRILAGAAYPMRGWKNFDRFLTALSRLTDESQRFFLRWENWIPLVDLLARSDLMASLLIHQPDVLQELPAGAEILGRQGRRQMEASLREVCGKGTAEAGKALCRFRRREMLRIGFRDLHGREGIRSIQRSLSLLAEVILSEALFLANQEVLGPRKARRRGPPGFGILSLGRLATRELGYLSDLDLVFLREESSHPSFPFHNEHQQVAERLIQILSTITQEGFLYEIDLRLRPSGGEGELIPTLGHFLDYFDTQAEIWERQAFLRCRPVAGESALMKRAIDGLRSRLPCNQDPRTLAGSISETRDQLEATSAPAGTRLDLKFGRGGMVEILFLLQFLQLASREFTLLRGDPPALLAAFRRNGTLSEESYRLLQSGYRFFRNLEHAIQLITGNRSDKVSLSGSLLPELALALDIDGGDQVLPKLEEFRWKIRRLYETTLKIL